MSYKIFHQSFLLDFVMFSVLSLILGIKKKIEKFFIRGHNRLTLSTLKTLALLKEELWNNILITFVE
ncbi:MAG TPA: hypothetical protein HPP56_08965 [Nitrospirae bacterium]|nr:hypothetical protein [Nitrospirota bacterium]